MRLVTLVCVGAVALSFSAESAEAQTPPKDVPEKRLQLRRIGRPIATPVPPPQVRREVRRIERPQRPVQPQKVELPQRQKVEIRTPQAVPANKPAASTAAVAPPPTTGAPVKRIGKTTYTGPRGADGMPLATSLILANKNCAGANAATDWCKARQKYNDDRTKYAADQAAWAKKKTEIDKQNAEIDKENAEKARKVAAARKENEAFEKAIEAKETARCKAEPPPCVRSLRQPHTIADVPVKRHNVVPPPPTAPTAAAILSTAPPPTAPAGAQPPNQPAGTPAANPTPSQPGGDRVASVPESARPLGSGGDNSRGSGGGRQEPVGSTPSTQPAPSATTLPTGAARPATVRPDAPAARVPAAVTTGGLAGTTTVATSAARGGQPAASSASWRHNTSEMQVVVEPQTPNALRIVYEKPRAGLAPLGINAGTVLFSGVRTGDTVTGQAMTFSKRCAPQAFAVSGRIVNESRVVLQGQKPSRNDDCAIVGSVDETLEFELIRR